LTLASPTPRVGAFGTRVAQSPRNSPAPSSIKYLMPNKALNIPLTQDNPLHSLSCPDKDSDTWFSEDDSTSKINLKKIQEFTSLKRKLSKIPDIRTLNLDTRNSSTQTPHQQDLQKLLQEKEKFYDLFKKEKENNSLLVQNLEEFKDKTAQLTHFIKDVEEKLQISHESENIHVKQSQELSNKCVEYSNQLMFVNARINELNQEFKKQKSLLISYNEALKLFNLDTGDLKEMILSEREDYDSKIKMLNNRISSMIQLNSSESCKLQMQDEMVISKLQDKITLLKQEAEKEKSLSKTNLEKSLYLKQELENLQRKHSNDGRELKKHLDKIDIYKEEITLYQAQISELQGSAVKKEQELYVYEQKFKNLQ
jgi:hypothetical protein